MRFVGSTHLIGLIPATIDHSTTRIPLPDRHAGSWASVRMEELVMEEVVEERRKKLLYLRDAHEGLTIEAADVGDIALLRLHYNLPEAYPHGHATGEMHPWPELAENHSTVPWRIGQEGL
jgi:hypothetical protein